MVRVSIGCSLSIRQWYYDSTIVRKDVPHVTAQASRSLGRESLYKALSSGGDPELATVQKVVRPLGIRLHITP